MKIKFHVDGQLVFGEISPRYNKGASIGGDGISKSCFKISFEAAPAIADRIHHYIDTLGRHHLDFFARKSCGSSLTIYSGSDVYVDTFYERLGLTLPALNEGREPALPEIIRFVLPPVAAVGCASAGAAAAVVEGGAAAAAGVDVDAIIASHTAYSEARLAYNTAKAQASLRRWWVEILQGRIPTFNPEQAALVESATAEQISEAVAACEALEAESRVRKEISDQAKLAYEELEPVPTILVPAADVDIEPIDVSSGALALDLDANGFPTCAPTMHKKGQTYRNE